MNIFYKPQIPKCRSTSKYLQFAFSTLLIIILTFFIKSGISACEPESVPALSTDNEYIENTVSESESTLQVNDTDSETSDSEVESVLNKQSENSYAELSETELTNIITQTPLLTESVPEEIDSITEETKSILKEEFTVSAEIISVLNADYLKNIPDVTLIQNFSQNTDALLSLIQTLQTIEAIALLPDGTMDSVTLPVEWNVGALDAPQIDASIPGTYEEHGHILLPDGYSFADGVLSELVITVHVIIPDTPVIITQIDALPAHADAYAFTVGTALEQIRASCCLTQYLQCFDADGNLYLADICWNFDEICSQNTGLYEIKGHIKPPEHTVFSETLYIEELTVPISIQELGKPEINCYYAGRGSFIFPWSTPPGSLDRITVWISKENGAWECYLRDSLFVYWDEYQLCIDSCLFEKNKNYRIQVEYDGGTTKILSFIYNSVLQIESYNEGDRDGGDANGFKPDLLPPNDPHPPVQTEPETEFQASEALPVTDENNSKTEQLFSKQNTFSYKADTFLSEQSCLLGGHLPLVLDFPALPRFSNEPFLNCLNVWCFYIPCLLCCLCHILYF